MAENPERFVVIDGVQIEKTRARRLGFIDDKDKIVNKSAAPKDKKSEGVDDAPDGAPAAAEPSSTRARGSAAASTK